MCGSCACYSENPLGKSKWQLNPLSKESCCSLKSTRVLFGKIPPFCLYTVMSRWIEERHDQPTSPLNHGKMMSHNYLQNNSNYQNLQIAKHLHSFRIKINLHKYGN
ncbi:unnamed protein product, partial [Vitis vinifera]